MQDSRRTQVVDPPAVLAFVRKTQRTWKVRARQRGVVVHRFIAA